MKPHIRRKKPLKRSALKRRPPRARKRKSFAYGLKKGKKGASRTTFKRAFMAAEQAMKQAVKRRDRHICQMRFYNENTHVCSGPLQVDHTVVSRRHLSTFFDTRQMTLLCQTAHFKKTYNLNGYNDLVMAIVRLREGEAVIREIIEESGRVKKWSVDELVQLTDKLNRMYNEKNEEQ